MEAWTKCRQMCAVNQYEQAMRSLQDQDGSRLPDVFEQNNILAEKNRNGIPDIVEDTSGERIFANAIKIVVDGMEFNNFDDLPPEARAKYEQAMGALDANRNGMPDLLEGMVGVQANPTSTSFATEQSPPISRTPMPVESPSITPDTSNGWMLGLLAVSILFLCLLVVVAGWYFFLR